MQTKCADCGVIYDDYDRWTFCPHDYFEPAWVTKDRMERMIAYTIWYETWFGMTPNQYNQMNGIVYA